MKKMLSADLNAAVNIAYIIGYKFVISK